MSDDRPHRSETTAHDGRPVCIECGRAYDPLRIVINHDKPRFQRKESCQRCRQRRRIAELKKARGY